MRRRYRYGVIALLSLGLCGIFGYTKDSEDLDNSVVDEAISYDVNDYKERLRTDRISVQDYGSQYSEDVSTVANMDYKQLHFDDVEFSDFPETNCLVLAASGQEEISVEDILEKTESWLRKIGKEDEVDLETELGFNYLNHPYLEISEDDLVLGDDPDFMWPLFYDHISELKYGSGAFIERNDCYMQSGAEGIYAMSDGAVSAFLKSKGIESSAHDIVAPGEFGTKVASGKIEELAEDSYTLLDGEMSIGEGSDAVEEYFLEDDARIRRDGVSLKAENIAVYEMHELEDYYYYEYSMRRFYYGIPLATSEDGTYSFYGTYHIAGEGGRAYVANHDGVTAYAGISDGKEMIPLLSEDSLISVAEAAEILSESLASQINVSVDLIELVYLDLRFEGSEDPTETIYFPCWCFSGKNRVKDEKIALYVDALTGDVYYYTWTSGEEYNVESTEENS